MMTMTETSFLTGRKQKPKQSKLDMKKSTLTYVNATPQKIKHTLFSAVTRPLQPLRGAAGEILWTGHLKSADFPEI